MADLSFPEGERRIRMGPAVEAGAFEKFEKAEGEGGEDLEDVVEVLLLLAVALGGHAGEAAGLEAVGTVEDADREVTRTAAPPEGPSGGWRWIPGLPGSSTSGRPP